MRPLVLSVLLLFTSPDLFSQKRNIFLELGGSGGLGSLNFEKTLRSLETKPSPDQIGLEVLPDWGFLTFRIGLAASPIDKNNGWVITTPVLTNFVFGEFWHKFELGAGLAPSITTKGSLFIRSPLVIGYRYWPQYKHVFLRVTYTPIVSWLVDLQWQHWFGASVGYRLGHQYE